MVTRDGEYLGAIGPFAVNVAWWSQVEPVVTHLRRVLGVPVLVVRLLHVQGGDGARDGHVTYHVEALERPAPGLLAETSAGDDAEGRAGSRAWLTESHELRSPWARVEGLREILGWASGVLAAAGRPVTGAVEQYRTWNLAGLFRLPTARGPVWLKTTPAFAADEVSVIAAFAAVDPGLVPVLIAAGERRMLMEHLPGEDCWHAPAGIIASGVDRLVAAQAAVAALSAGCPAGLRDRRAPVLADQIRELLDGDAVAELTAEELAEARALADRWPALQDCGLPDTIVHGDFHPGNMRSDGGQPVLFDFADAFFGNPVLDGLRLRDYLPPAERPAAARAWISAWSTHVPGCDPARALAVGEPLAHLAYAVRYQEFLDGIEPDEMIYHLGDPAAVVRSALRCARV
ncbi:aminoglycoside phosphotransferase family protein [Actinomadura sp. HBU206391]|nr:aminoglycoside phosphotransferase family protein [Actinomadura sp. HBU206391]